MKQTSRKKLPKQSLRSALDNLTVTDDTRTVELVWTTGFKGMRSNWGERYFEELSLENGEVDLSRLQTGAPLLAAHDASSLNAVVGVVERAWIENGEGKATVRFSSDADSEKIYLKVKEKILRNISVGYNVEQYRNVSLPDDEIPTLRATRWTPMEISIVPIGFDPHAQIRSEGIEETEVEIISEVKEENQTVSEIETTQQKEERMKFDANGNPIVETTATPVDVEAIKREAIAQEQTRCTEIQTAVRTAKLDESVATELIKTNVSADQARKQIFEKMSEAAKATEITSQVRIEVGTSDSEKKRDGMVDALISKIDRSVAPTEQSRLFQGKSFLRMLEDVMPRKLGESDALFAKRAMSSSDLPYILANVAEKSIQKKYELAPKTFKAWTKQDSLRNYKSHSQVKSGDFASLVERPEGDEYQYGATGEDRESVQLKDHGIIHGFTSQMIVNDDLGVIKQLASQGGTAAARLENRLAYLALTTNKVMNDGTALYDVAVHKNLGTAGAIAQASVAEAYKFMRKQKSVNGLDTLNLTPKFLICGPDKEIEARMFLAAIVANQTSNVNVFSNSMELVVDAEITGNQYYFAADPNLCDTVTVYGLEGASGPVISTRNRFENDDIEIKVAHSCVAAPMDWRGLVKNAGN